MRRASLAIALCLLHLANGHALAQLPTSPSSVQPVTIPFELLKTKHMTVTIRVNGKGPYRVIFDTGAPMTVLSRKVARESGILGTSPKPGPRLFSTNAGGVTLGLLEVGPLQVRSIPALIMDHPTVTELAAGVGPLEGILGFPFFARYRMTMDYQAKTLTFVPNGYEPPDVFKALMGELDRLAAPGKESVAPNILSPAAQWGFVAERGPNEQEPGITIREVLPGSATAKAGLQRGDRLLTLDGRWTDSLPDLFHAAAYIKPGVDVVLTVRRDRKERTLTVRPTSGL